jgi:hypothetical protein
LFLFLNRTSPGDEREASVPPALGDLHGLVNAVVARDKRLAGAVLLRVDASIKDASIRVVGSKGPSLQLVPWKQPHDAT